jgi:hypothetical protein
MQMSTNDPKRTFVCAAALFAFGSGKLNFLFRSGTIDHSDSVRLVRRGGAHNFAADAPPRQCFGGVHLSGNFERARRIESATGEHLSAAKVRNAPAHCGRADWAEIIFNCLSAFRDARECSNFAMKFFEVGVLNRDRNAVGAARALLTCIAVAKLSIEMAGDGEPNRPARAPS